LTFRGKPIYKNDEIIFDNVRVLDRAGVLLGEMSTVDGIDLAKAHAMDLQLIDYEQEPVTCVIADDKSLSDLIRKFSGSPPDTTAFSFDPTLRPSTIRFSSLVADDDFERKTDILRNHLLDKRRCIVEIFTNRDLQSSEDDLADTIKKLRSRIIDEVRDIAKPVDDSELEASPDGTVRFRLWPCTPDQAGEKPLMHIDVSKEQQVIERTPRRIRTRSDPKLSPPNLDDS